MDPGHSKIKRDTTDPKEWLMLFKLLNFRPQQNTDTDLNILIFCSITLLK